MTPAAGNRDEQTILCAYDAAVTKLYAMMFDAFASSAGNTAQMQQAEQQFVNGLNFARQARDRALARI